MHCLLSCQALCVTTCNASWVNLWSSSFSLCLDGVNMSCVCGIQPEFKSSALSLVMLSKTQYKRPVFLFFKDTLKHVTVNKRDNRKDQIYARVNATRPKSRKDRSTCSTEQTLQKPTKSVTLNIKT